MVDFIFGGDATRQLASQSLDLYSVYSQSNPNGIPQEFVDLIKKQLPNYQQTRARQDIPVIVDLVRSHLVAESYLTMKTQDYTTEIDGIDDAKYGIMLDRLAHLTPLVIQLTDLYKFLMLYYFIWIIDYFEQARNVNGLPILRIPEETQLLLARYLLPPEQGAQPQTEQQEQQQAEEEMQANYRAYSQDLTFDLLNASFAKSQMDDFIEDENFRTYLLDRTNAFVVNFENEEEHSRPGGTKKPVPQKACTEPPCYVKHKLENMPILQLHYLFVEYQKYTAQYSKSLQQEVARVDNAIKLATQKLNQLVGEERVESHPNREINYTNRRSFVTQPINSGIVRVRADIKAIINRAFHNVIENCHGLAGLKLEDLQTGEAFESGLMTDFVEYMTVAYTRNTLRFQDSYKSREQYSMTNTDLFNTMLKLRTWTYTRRGTRFLFRKLDKPVARRGYAASAASPYTTCNRGGGCTVNVMGFQ